jgi:hypothetical protein
MDGVKTAARGRCQTSHASPQRTTELAVPTPHQKALFVFPRTPTNAIANASKPKSGTTTYVMRLARRSLARIFAMICSSPASAPEQGTALLPLMLAPSSGVIGPVTLGLFNKIVTHRLHLRSQFHRPAAERPEPNSVLVAEWLIIMA